jgi:RNA polymerase sigma factor (sigma-70 family)
VEQARESLPTEPLSAEPLPPSDADLIAACRNGDATAFDTLYRRHAVAARTLARQLVRGQAEADDVTAETFAKILDLLRRGGGPQGAFRPYLLTSVRRAAYDRHRAERRQVVSGEMESFDPGVPFADPAVAALERTMIARAFASLPERWQAVLWHTEIEGARPAEVATLLGLTANGVAALAYRAREGLRQAYLQMHLSGEAREGCRPVAAKLGAYVRGGLAKRDAALVAAHLDQCAECRRIFAELGDVDVALRTVVAPVVLGPAAAAYLASVAGHGSAAGWVAARLGRVAWHAVRGQQAAVTAAAAATVALMAAAAAMGGHSGPVPRPAAARSAPAAVTVPSPAAMGTSAPVLPPPARAAAPLPQRLGEHRRPAVTAAPRARNSSVPQTLSQPGPSSAGSLAPPAPDPSRPPRPVALPPPAPAPGPSSVSPPPAPPTSAPPATPSTPATPPAAPAAPAVAAAPAPALPQPAPAPPAAPSGISILGLNLTVPVVGVQVSANVSLPLGISLGIGGASSTSG